MMPACEGTKRGGELGTLRYRLFGTKDGKGREPSSSTELEVQRGGELARGR